MHLTSQEKKAILHNLTTVASTIARKKVPVKEITSGDDLGYTDASNVIHVSLENKQYEHLSKAETFTMIRGIGNHELLHILITNFDEYTSSIHYHESYERPIFADILNVCEDGAIEYFAPSYLSEELVRSLEFVRAVIYKNANDLEDCTTPFLQFFTAFLHFRFFGFLKGSFTFDEAEQAFRDSITHMAAAFEEPTQSGRIKCADAILEITRPLWEQDAKDSEALKEALDEIMKSFSSSANQGSGTGNDSSEAPENSDSGVERRRRITIRKVSREEFEKAMDESENAGGLPESGDIEILIPDEPVSNENSEDTKNDDSIAIPSTSGSIPSESEENEDKATAGDTNDLPTDESDSKSSSSSSDDEHVEDGEHKADNSSCESADNSESEGADGTPPSAQDTTMSQNNGTKEPGVTNGDSKVSSGLPPKGEVNTAEDDGSADDDSEIESEIHLSEDELLALSEIVSAYEHEEEKANRGSNVEDAGAPDLPVGKGLKGVCAKARCKNIVVNVSATDKAIQEYNSIVKTMEMGIKHLASQIERIFRNRKEETVYKQSGKISAKRLNSGRMTSRVFTKRRHPETSELAVVFALDISGSMGGYKILVARNIIIALTEVFGKLGIPVYVIGFTADTEKADVVHYHYIDWSNKPTKRLSLLSITAKANNFDGYSIRYATELLKRVDAEKKLLFVVSDGLPACAAYGYGANVNGIQDVKLAVSEANKYATTIGVLLGDESPEMHRYMYGYNFVHCNKVTDLFQKLGKTLTRLI